MPRGGEETNICPFLKLAFPESAPVCAGAFFGAMAGREIPCVALRGGAAASGGGRGVWRNFIEKLLKSLTFLTLPR
ncbi:MAG: hypothetical protein DBY30_07370 [Verrucomicrobia bacterium]|nr:MAG: hypothetical protein DBY30_07370 [Verrucomicrobiota bacterium]